MYKLSYPKEEPSFEALRAQGGVYVDKSELIYSLAKYNVRTVFHRPSGLGKSLLLSTLKAYFAGKQELFEGLKIASWEHEWRPYNVLHLDFGTFKSPALLSLSEQLHAYLANLERAYGIEDIIDPNPASRLAHIIKQAYKSTGRPVVLLIDNYDQPLSALQPSAYSELTRESVGMMRSCWAALKLADEYLHFVLLVGKTNWIRDLDLAQLDDLSLSPEFESLCGFTQAEIKTYLAQPLQALALDRGEALELTIERLQENYGSYCFSDKLTHLYQPTSLLKALEHQELKHYSTYLESIATAQVLLERNKTSLASLAGEYYPPCCFASYSAASPEPLAWLYQQGLLTIKAYDSTRQRYLLDIHNIHSQLLSHFAL